MAKDANQRSSAEGIVRLDTVVGRILLSGGPARLLAPGGAYDLSQQVLNVAVGSVTPISVPATLAV